MSDNNDHIIWPDWNDHGGPALYAPSTGSAAAYKDRLWRELAERQAQTSQESTATPEPLQSYQLRESQYRQVDEWQTQTSPPPSPPPNHVPPEGNPAFGAVGVAVIVAGVMLAQASRARLTQAGAKGYARTREHGIHERSR